MKKNHKGFTSVELLIVVAVVGLVGLLGWFVWDKQKDANTDKVNQTEQTSNSLCKTDVEDQKSWKVATSSQNSFSMCVPGGWTLTSSIEAESFIVTPPFTINKTEEAVIKDEDIGGGDGTSDEFQVFKAEENYLGWVDPQTAEKTTFMLSDGTTGDRYYTKHTNVGEGIGPVEGEEDYEYLFEKNGKFIHAVYSIHPGTDKELEAVESVLKTLVIN